jgi:lysophospholipase L1-like esterase
MTVLRTRDLASAALLSTIAVLALASPGATAAAKTQAWVAAWAASPEPADPDPDEPLLKLADQTVRERVRLSSGGEMVRVRLTNAYGSTPLLIGSATAATPSDAASVSVGSIRSLTFRGRRTVTIPTGASMLSDPVNLPVAAGREISVSLYFPQAVATPTLHAVALKEAIVSPPGDFTHALELKTLSRSQSSILVSQVLTPARPGQRLVAAFGDSITEGVGSTAGADRGWPSDLARRLIAGGAEANVAVVNEGIAGNRLLADGPIGSLGISGLARLDRDGLSLPGLTHVILFEGVNDIGFPGANLHGLALADPANQPSAQDLIDGYRRFIAAAHAHGVKVIGATLTPCEGVAMPGYYSETKNAEREAVNRWIRGGGAFDGVIDFDAVLRDPGHPSRLQPRYASPDHLHPNDAGHQAMADAVDLALFRRSPGR